MTDEVQEISLENLQRVELKPGDRFVLTVPRPISAEVAARIQELWTEFTSGEVPLLILEDGMRLGIINLEAAA